MLVVGKVVCSGIVFVLLSPWISGPRPSSQASSLDAGANFSGEASGAAKGNDVREVQQTLQDEGHYRGKVDGVFGLRTRASVRAYQKAENLPVTGQLDAQTATRLGVRPEARQDASYEATQDKPSAGIKWANGSPRSALQVRTPSRKLGGKIPPQ